jgi:hypothetical protein
MTLLSLYLGEYQRDHVNLNLKRFIYIKPVDDGRIDEVQSWGWEQISEVVIFQVRTHIRSNLNKRLSGVWRVEKSQTLKFFG